LQERNLRQAFLPGDSVPLLNFWGTAPGFFLPPSGGFGALVALPVVPHEWKEMWARYAGRIVFAPFKNRPISKLTSLHFSMVPESHINEGILQLKDLERSYKLIQAPNSATTTCFLLSQATRYALEQKAKTVSVQVENLKKSLKSMLEIPKDTSLILTDPIKEDVTAEEMKDSAGKRADISGLSLNLEALRYQKKSVYSMFAPRVDFFTSYAYNHPVFDSGEDAYELGFMLTFNVFDYSRYGRLDEIKALENRIDFAYREKLKNNRTAIDNALNSLSGRKEELKLAKASFGKADEALQFANLRYKQGTLPLKDLSDAIAKWVQAKVNVSTARYNLMDSHVELKFERGEI
jgi:outer membrane protein TolC